MARYFKFLTLTGCLLLAACQEGHQAGELLGQWRLDGSSTHYLRFSGSIACVADIPTAEVFGNFQRSADSLFIQCYSIKGEPKDTVAVEESFGFKPFNNIRLKLELIDGDRLVLSQQGRTWSFRKY